MACICWQEGVLALASQYEKAQVKPCSSPSVSLATSTPSLYVTASTEVPVTYGDLHGTGHAAVWTNASLMVIAMQKLLAGKHHASLQCRRALPGCWAQMAVL